MCAVIVLIAQHRLCIRALQFHTHEKSVLILPMSIFVCSMTGAYARRIPLIFHHDKMHTHNNSAQTNLISFLYFGDKYILHKIYASNIFDILFNGGGGSGRIDCVDVSFMLKCRKVLAMCIQANYTMVYDWGDCVRDPICAPCLQQNHDSSRHQQNNCAALHYTVRSYTNAQAYSSQFSTSIPFPSPQYPISHT